MAQEVKNPIYEEAQVTAEVWRCGFNPKTQWIKGSGTAAPATYIGLQLGFKPTLGISICCGCSHKKIK